MQDVRARFSGFWVKDPDAPKPKRRRGRQHLSLASHPERYWRALLQAHIEIGKARGLSEFKVAEMLVTMRFGNPRNPDDVLGGWFYLGVWLQGQRRAELEELLAARRKRASLNLRCAALEHRDSNAFRPKTDTELRTLRKVRSLSRNDPNREWLRLMTLAWEPCLNGQLEYFVGACWLAQAAGEVPYFNAIMRPVMIMRSQQGAADHAEWLVKNIRSLI
jgi:hypothetical protein